MKITHGTCRLVILTRKHAYKLPMGLRGIKANKAEYQNSFGKNYVAKTERKWYGLRQEKLTDLITLPKDYDGEIKSEWKHLWELKLHNRLQIGKGVDGVWKFFDYEDVKFYEKLKRR